MASSASLASSPSSLAIVGRSCIGSRSFSRPGHPCWQHRPRPIPDLGDDRSEVGHIGQIGSGGHVVILATIALIVGRICIGSGGRSGRPRSGRPVSGPGPPPEPIERVRQGRAGPGRTKLLMQRSSATGATTGIGERDNMLPMATEETPGLNSLNCRALSCGPPLTRILPFLVDFFVLDRPKVWGESVPKCSRALRRGAFYSDQMLSSESSLCPNA